MHYRNGREAKNGDKIVQLDTEGGRVNAFGVLYNATPGNDYCNGSIAPAQSTTAGACMCDCLHVDDLAAILAEKGLDKRPVTGSGTLTCPSGTSKPADFATIATSGAPAAVPVTTAQPETTTSAPANGNS